MNKIVLNEKSFAEECLQSKTTNIDTYSTLVILGKYYCHCCGYVKNDIYTLLIKFLIDSNSLDYARSKQYWEDTCERIANKCDKYPLYEVGGVWITTKEFKAIKKLENKVLERLAFTLLCLAKYNATRHAGSYWVNLDFKDIFSLARVTCKKDERAKKIRELLTLGYIGMAKQVDNLSINVLFVDTKTTDYSEDQGDLFVFDFRELGYEYRKYSGENFIRCAECGILTRSGERGTRRYCKNCVNTTKPENKKIICKDCGKIVIVSKYNTKTCRCISCQEMADKESKKMWKRQNV